MVSGSGPLPGSARVSHREGVGSRYDFATCSPPPAKQQKGEGGESKLDNVTQGIKQRHQLQKLHPRARDCLGQTLGRPLRTTLAGSLARLRNSYVASNEDKIESMDWEKQKGHPPLHG